VLGLIAMIAAALTGSPWTVRPIQAREPLRCPASSSRAGWPSRVVALDHHTYVKLWARRPRLATVDARGHVLRTRSLGARGPADEQALACGRGGKTVAAWTEYREGAYAVRVEGRTVDTVRAQDGPGLAVAVASDGSTLVAYSVPGAVRAVVVSRSGVAGEPFRLGPASEVTSIAAEVGSGGRVVAAWTTIDGGEERNERRRVYAVRGQGGRFGRAQRVDRAQHLNISERTPSRVRLAVAPNGRALLMWQTTAGVEADGFTVRVAEAGRNGRFRTPRELTDDGTAGDVAIRSNGDTLAVWTDQEGLHAADGTSITGKATEPRASFRHGKPHVEWRGGAATRG
jgi:hypothetical protein